MPFLMAQLSHCSQIRRRDYRTGGGHCRMPGPDEHGPAGKYTAGRAVPFATETRLALPLPVPGRAARISTV